MEKDDSQHVKQCGNALTLQNGSILGMVIDQRRETHLLTLEDKRIETILGHTGHNETQRLKYIR